MENKIQKTSNPGFRGNHEIFWQLKTMILLFILFPLLTVSQETKNGVFHFEDRTEKAYNTHISVTPRHHYLGDEIGKKYAIFLQMYSFRTAGGGSFHTGDHLVINKPEIYKSVRKIDRHYRKLYRSNKISEEEARNKVNHLLDVAVSIYSQPTDDFEFMLKESKSVEDQAKLFESVVLK